MRKTTIVAVALLCFVGLSASKCVFNVDQPEKTDTEQAT